METPEILETFEERYSYFMFTELSKKLKEHYDPFYEFSFTEECDWLELIEHNEKYMQELTEKMIQKQKQKLAEEL